MLFKLKINIYTLSRTENNKIKIKIYYIKLVSSNRKPSTNITKITVINFMEEFAYSIFAI